MKKQMLLVAICSLLLTGCSNPINLKNAQNYYDAGQLAMRNGDWELARINFSKAVINSQLGNAPDRSRSMTLYEYARAAGVTCFYDEADKYLRQALELDRASNGPIYYPLIELARLNLDQGKFSEAVPYFKEVDPIFLEIDVIKKDPVGYADFLDEYATALKGAELQTEVVKIREREKDIRARNQGVVSRAERTPYGKHCKSK